MSAYVVINDMRCVGCGVCVQACPEGALRLERRPVPEVTVPPANQQDWQVQRAAARGIDLAQVL